MEITSNNTTSVAALSPCRLKRPASDITASKVTSIALTNEEAIAIYIDALSAGETKA